MTEIAEPRKLAAERVNIARRLTETAARMPDALAVVVPRRRRGGQRRYDTLTFQQLEDETNRLASGLLAAGLTPGVRIALLVRPGREFIALVFALFKAGAVVVLIDPGMGRKNLIRCLSDVEPAGFVAIPIAQWIRRIFRRRFPHARLNVTVGRRLLGGGLTLDDVRQMGRDAACCHDTTSDEPAAIIFTSGGTGPPKGVLYRHGNFDRQVSEIRDFYDIRPGEIDLAAFPLFGLFNCAMGVTTVAPDMDASRRSASIRGTSWKPCATGKLPSRLARRRFGTAWASIVSGKTSRCHRCAGYCRPERRCLRTSWHA